MAKTRSRAGRYAWRQHQRKMLPWLLVSLAPILGYPVLLFAFVLSGKWGFWAIGLFYFLSIRSFFVLSRRIDAASSGWEEGARGEMLVGKELEKLHKEGFHVFHDYHSSGRGNVDHFIVGPPGVFAIETKAWNGEITFEDGAFRVDGRPVVKDPIKQVRGEAKDVGELIQRSCGIKPWVHPVICFSKGELRHYGPVEKVEVTNVGSLNRAIMQAPRRYSDELSPSSVRVISGRLQKYLGELPAAAPGSPPRIPGKLRRAAKPERVFVAGYALFVLLLSVVFAGSTARVLGGLADFYRALDELWRFLL